MESTKYITLLLLLLLASGCITPFIPESDETQELVVVEGLITDKEEANTIKLSKSMPLGKRSNVQPLKGCTVIITDDLGNSHELTESAFGNYVTNKDSFRGVIGRKYTLHIYTNGSTGNQFSYQSSPMEMKGVPPIDSVYFEKILIEGQKPWSPPKEGCQIYLASNDPGNNSRFYRWDYTETWKFSLPFPAPVNNPCWITNNSSVIRIKNTSGLAENKISRYSVKFISNETDRLKEKYSILVNQYSLSEEEYSYWEKLQSVSEDIGSLYDITPASIPGNIYCVEDPGEKALGYFSVSAKSSKRIFIDDYFSGIVNLYKDCITDTIAGLAPPPDLNVFVWILEINYRGYLVVTSHRFCADCTTRGSLLKPDFWDDDNN